MTRTDTLRFAHSLHLNGGALRVEKQHCHIVFAKIQHFEAGSGLTMLGKDAKVATACDQQLTDVAFPNFEPLNDLLEASFRSRLICLQQNIRNDEQHSFILPRLQDSVSQSCLSKAAMYISRSEKLLHKLIPRMFDSDEVEAPPRAPSTDSQRTAVQHTHGQLDDDERTAYSPNYSVYKDGSTADSLPDPEYFASRFGLTMEELRISDDDSGDSLEMNLPDPCVFEISDDDAEESTFPAQTVCDGENAASEVPTTAKKAHNEDPDNYKIHIASGDVDDFRVILTSLADDGVPICSCDIRVLAATQCSGQDGENKQVKAAVLANIGVLRKDLGKILLEKVGELLDRHCLISIIYTTMPGQLVCSPQWKRQSIPQLRIQMHGPHMLMDTHGTARISLLGLRDLMHKSNGANQVHFIRESNASSERSLTINEPYAFTHAKAGHEEKPCPRGELPGMWLAQVGVAAEQRQDEPGEAWLSWSIPRKELGALFVNRVAVRSPVGYTLELLGFLKQCIDVAYAHNLSNVIIWDPPAEMYDAAIALADEKWSGLWYQVYKEDTAHDIGIGFPVQVFTRWHPACDENDIWKDKQLYCYAGTAECTSSYDPA